MEKMLDRGIGKAKTTEEVKHSGEVTYNVFKESSTEELLKQLEE